MAGARARRGRMPKGNGSALAASAARHGAPTVKQALDCGFESTGACATARMRQAGARSSIVSTAALLASAVALAASAPAHAPVPPAAPASAMAASSAAPATLSDACPAQLPVKQTVSEAMPGWTPLDQQGSHPFVRVAFYPGPPAEASLIVPTVEYKGQSGLHDGWDLPRRAGGYWMTCAYGNTTATVARQLAEDVDFCQADYDGRFFTLVVRHWSCGVKRSMAPPVWARPASRTPKPAARPSIKRVD